MSIKQLGFALALLVGLNPNGQAQSPGGISSNLRWWLKANSGVYSDNGTTLISANGTAVQQWNDFSTIANHARQTTTANQPFYSTNVINSYPTVHFSGDQFLDALALPGIGATNSWTFFMVVRPTSFTAGGTADGIGTYIIDRTSNSNNLTSIKIVNTDKFYLQKRNDDNSGIGGPISTTPAGTSSFLITDFYRSFGTGYGIFVNGKSDGVSGDDNGNLTGPQIRLGRHFNTTGGGLNGDLAEMIMYNNFPSTAERQQIESYLAIKYGVTLDQSLGGKDYLSSTGAIIYPASTTYATYNDNIAGLGQDNGSGLQQTASQSQNAGAVLSIASASAISDGNFLMWGDDSPTITNSSNAPAPYLNRLSRVWRAKATGGVGTVTMNFDLSGLGMSLATPAKFALLTNSSPDMSGATPFTTTMTIVGNVVSFTGITLTDGLYFSLASDVIPGPGGVSPAVVWLRADQGAYVNAGTTLATNGQKVQQWNNYQGSATFNASQATSGNRPTYFTALANNNSTITYAGGSSSLDLGAIAIPSSSSLEAFTVIKPASFNSTGSVSDGNGSYFVDRTSGTNALFGLKASGTKFGFQKRNDAGNFLGGVATLSSINTVANQIVNYYRNYNVQYGIGYNGSIEAALADADGPTTLPSLRFGNHASTGVGLTGDLPEYILFVRNLSTNERTRVNTYLALKYGITLSQTVATDYISSVNTIIYPASSTYSSYSSDVAGIGRDDVSGLLQLSSQSVNVNGMVKMTALSFASNISFLIWGSNNGSITTPNTSDVQAPVLRRLSRVWRVVNTNSVGAVDIAIDLSGVPGAKAQADLRLLIDADGVFNAGATPMTGTLVGNIFTVTGVTLTSGYYFTIGTTSLSTPLPVELTKFEVANQEESVLASWETASELNSDHFEIHRSVDGAEFEWVGVVKANGTTSKVHQYTLEDFHPLDGKSYYRLREKDINGTYHDYPLKEIDRDGTAPRISVYPNPATGSQFNLLLENWKSGTAYVKVTDLLGNVIVQENLSVSEPTTNYVFNLDGKTRPGVYIVTVGGSSRSYNCKVIVKD